MPYRTQSSDTHPSVERIQVEHLRRMGAGKRWALLRSLNRSQNVMAWRGMQRVNAHLSPREMQVRAVEIRYGSEHAARLKAALQERGLWT